MIALLLVLLLAFVSLSVYLLFNKLKDASHCSAVEKELATLKINADNLSKQLATLVDKNLMLEIEKSTLAVRFEESVKYQSELKKELELIGEKLLEKTRTKNNEESMQLITQAIKPYKDAMDEVRNKLTEDLKEKIDFKGAFIEQIKMIKDTTEAQSDVAKKLTEALTQKPKVGGNWGEEILESILKSSGLEEGANYEKQFLVKNEDGQKQIPDIVLKLNGGNIIIDSKLSIVNYMNYQNAQNEDEKQLYIKELIKNTKYHIDSLSEKSYHQVNLEKEIIGDVIIFIPIEAVYYLITQSKEDNIHQYAWKKRIILAGPYNLMAILRAVASVDRITKATKNVKEATEVVKEACNRIISFLVEFENLSNLIKKHQNQLAAQMESTVKKISGQQGVVKSLKKLEKMGFTEEKDRYKIQGLGVDEDSLNTLKFDASELDE